MPPDSPRRTDPLAVLEAFLGLLFFGLGVALFVIPAADGGFLPRWWAWVVLALLFFGLLALDTYRRRRRNRTELRDVLRRGEDEVRPGRGGAPPAA